MTHKNLQNRVEMTPKPFDGATTMLSQTENPTQSHLSQNSISEAEYSIRLGWGARHMLNLRKAGKLPAHFLAHQPGRAKPQIRYRLVDIGVVTT
jgi:hypothetical protein